MAENAKKSWVFTYIHSLEVSWFLLAARYILILVRLYCIIWLQKHATEFVLTTFHCHACAPPDVISVTLPTIPALLVRFGRRRWRCLPWLAPLSNATSLHSALKELRFFCDELSWIVNIIGCCWYSEHRSWIEEFGSVLSPSCNLDIIALLMWHWLRRENVDVGV